MQRNLFPTDAPRGAYGQIIEPVPTAPYSNETTSREAAEAIAPSVNEIQREVLAYLRRRGPHGATDEEGEDDLGRRHQTYSPRRCELVAKGEVIDSGRRRKVKSGRTAIVWVVTSEEGD